MFKIISYKSGEGWVAQGFAPKAEIAAKALLNTGRADVVYAFEKGQDAGFKFGYDPREGMWKMPASRSYEQGIRNWTLKAAKLVAAV